MATKPVPPMAGLVEIIQFLDLITHPEKYKSKLMELEGLREKINEQVRQIGLKGDADNLLASAKAKESRAKQRLESASIEADSILSSARIEAERIKQESASDCEKRSLVIERKESELLKLKEELEGKEKELQRESQKVSERASVASDEMKKALAIKTEYEAKLRSIRGALAVAEG